MLSSLLLACIVAAQDQPPPPPREFRAVWVAMVDNIDWPSKRGLETAKARAELLEILNTSKALRLNAVILQMRPTADALYPSKVEPWSEYLTGEQGKAPEPYWDPLEFAVEEAHKRGMELHVWINPYRARHPSSRSLVHPTHVAKAKPHIVRTYGRHLWMDPGEPDTQNHSMAVINDMVKRYDLDGIHYDDYFYPYQERDAQGKLIPFPDEDSYRAYLQKGGSLSRDDWRRNNVDTFVSRIYREVKRAKPWVKVGISPFGIYRPGVPEGIAAGVDQYADLYADAKKWLVEGWCDYFTPQLYWPIAQTKQSYPVLLKWWLENNPKKRHLWPGNFTSQLGTSANWAADELVNQIKLTREMGAGGNVHFSMKAFTNNSKGINEVLRTGLYSGLAAVPASPWLDSRAPAAPTVRVRKSPAGDLLFSLSTRESDARAYLIHTRVKGKWGLREIVGTTAADYAISAVDARGGLEAVAISVLDRTGNEGARSLHKP